MSNVVPSSSITRVPRGRPPRRIRTGTWKQKVRKDWMFYAMFLPVLVFMLLFNYAPMAGVRFAFFKFTPFRREFIGLANFAELFTGIRSVNFWRAFRNTFSLSLLNLFLGTFISVVVALLLNELVMKKLKSAVQTVLYLPHFMSWVVTASIFMIIMSPSQGFLNNILGLFGIDPIYFLAKEEWWTPVYLFIVRWKETGWGTIIYLAALAGINPELYEAATIDGANRWQKVISITIPTLMPTILTVFILNLGKVMNIFESVFVLMNPNVYSVSDVISVFAYRVGIEQGNYGMGTAIGLFKSVVGLVMVMITDTINRRMRGSSLL